LNAAGCYTVYSCSGHNHALGYPYISFCVRPGSLLILIEIAKEAEIGLINGADGYAEIFSDRMNGLLDFAGKLIARKTYFKSLPLIEISGDEE
jgi:hypothetical protein